MGGENLTKPFRRVDLRKECELSHVGDIKGPARLSGGLKQPIGCRQREHVVVKENGKARRGFHTNENSQNLAILTWQRMLIMVNAHLAHARTLPACGCACL